ncbi:MAG: SPOR domain-containing protein [Candidatus Eisenbacteria bacterium]|uniref:SPOR domain-containing protein n=1 Tax=Eiseniibacteriota bacterium TaxID=2212470 RepID=A0A938BNX3_UNCEI|nr:SPOR domain-containing protein [Candidatus Eisenbacteria bacterium]
MSPPAEVAVPAGREAAAATDGSRERTIHDMVLDRGGPFAVLCGSFRSERRAETEAARLAQGGHPARLVTVRIPEQGVWHRVLVGECAGEEAARALAREVAAARIVPACQVVTAAGVGIAIGGPISGGGS